MPPLAPSPEFLARVVAHDPAAEHEFVRQFTGPLHALLRKYFGRLTASERDELVQDALASAIRSLPRYDPEKRFITWLFTIARRRAIDLVERTKNEWIDTPSGSILRDASYEEMTARGAPPEYSRQVQAGLEQMAEERAGAPGTGRPSIGRELDALEAWLAQQSPEDQIVARKYKHDLEWKVVAAEATNLGYPMNAGGARVRGHRLLARARRELGAQLAADEAVVGPPDATP